MLYLLIGVAAFILLVVTGVLISNRNRIKKDEQYQAELKARSQSLDVMLSNPRNKGQPDADKPYQPYKVSYTEGKREDGPGGQMFRLVEKNERLDKAYLFSQEETAYIGGQNGELVVWKNSDGKDIYCKIACRQGLYYIRPTGRVSVKVTRKRKQTVVDQKGVCLKSGDSIQICSTELLFEILK